LLAVALALASAACYGVSNFVGPELAKQHTIVAVLVTSQIAALFACLAYVAAAGEEPLGGGSTGIALLAGVGNAGGLIGFYRAAELGPLSVAAPIGALGAIVPVLWDLIGGEPLRTTEALGIVLALGGGALAARVTRSEEVVYENPRASVLWAAASAAFFGIFLVALPHASDDGRAWALLDARVALVVIMLVWAGRRLRDVRPGRSSLLLAVPGLLLFTGTLLYTVATDHGPIAIVSVVGSLFPVVTVGLAAVLLAERLSREQWIGVVGAMAGIGLIAL